MKKIIFFLIIVLALIIVLGFQNERMKKTNESVLLKIHKAVRRAR